MGAPGGASHRWAARKYGLRGIDEEIVEITTSSRVRSREFIIHHDWTLTDRPRRHVEGIPVVSVERTLMGLAAVVSPRRFEIALDDALARRLTTLDRLEEELEARARRGRNGTKAFRAAIDARLGIKGQPERIDEADLLAVLRDYGVELPVAQHRVYVDGRFVARPDFSYPDCDFHIEVDTMLWHSGRIDLQNDVRKQNALIAAGHTVLRFTREDIRERSAATAYLVRDTLHRCRAKHSRAQEPRITEAPAVRTS